MTATGCAVSGWFWTSWSHNNYFRLSIRSSRSRTDANNPADGSAF